MDLAVQDTIGKLSEKLRCSVVAIDFARLKYAREVLAHLQHQAIFKEIFSNKSEQESLCTEENPCTSSSELPSKLGLDASKDTLGGEQEEGGSESLLCTAPAVKCTCMETSSSSSSTCECTCALVKPTAYEDIWHGYFTGYEILDDRPDFSEFAPKQCVELTKEGCPEKLVVYLRDGVRCFLLDLFTGTDIENQTIIVQLRESELNVSREQGFPITSTIIAKLSPRYQYLGILNPPDAVLPLVKGDIICLTSNRYYSGRSDLENLYVNARFLMLDLEPCDFILIGPDIQVRVKQKDEHGVICVVAVGGDVTSHLPVLFPRKCKRFRVSIEELEDITFAKEVGINVVISGMIGTKEYFDELVHNMTLLECGDLRLFARFGLEEKQCVESLNWAADCYDGFLFELSLEHQKPDATGIVRMGDALASLLEQAYDKQKPILYYPEGIAEQRLIVDTPYERHFFHFPDKFIFKCHKMQACYYFFLLRNAIYRCMSHPELTNLLPCGSIANDLNSIARACVAASHEIAARAIFVHSLSASTVIRLAHYRPHAPIIFVSGIRSFADFVSVYQNVIFLGFNACEEQTSKDDVYKHFIFGLVYAQSRRLIEHGDQVLFVYGHEPITKYSDNFVSYKYNENYFAEHLKDVLFRLNV